MEFRNLLLKKEEGMAILSLNRPEALNALNAEVAEEIRRAAFEVEKDDEVRAVIVTGEGRAFCAGADIKEVKELTPMGIREWARSLFKAIEILGGISKPVIAAVNGLTLGGGCELALGCDFIIASDKAQFGVPEIKIGVLPGAGGMSRLARAVGIRKAKEMVFTGDPIDAQTALKIGLVNKVCEADKLMEEVKNIARAISSRPPISVELAKATLDETKDSPLVDAVVRDIETVALTFSTSDLREGMAAFVEKRKPAFKGR
jgi:enoyl-CoA hydratase